MARRRAGERFVKDAPYDVRDKDAEIRAATSYVPRKSSRNGAVIFNIATFIATCAAVLGIAFAATGGAGIEAIVAMLLAALLVLSSTHIALSWEKVVVLRFGKLNRVVGPGLYFTIPVIEHGTIRVDQRTIATPFYAEKTLTADLVPVTVDAVLFWVVWDAEKACLEVENYPKAVLWSAQTAMRDAIGQLNLADLSMRRKQIDRELQEVMGAKCEQWGITVMSVEIRDIMVPRGLQDALSKEAQAEREKNARMVLAEVEKDISSMLVDAAHVYEENEVALRLRTMHLLYESVKGSGGTVVIPSAYSEGFSDAALKNMADSLKTPKG